MKEKTTKRTGSQFIKQKPRSGFDPITEPLEQSKSRELWKMLRNGQDGAVLEMLEKTPRLLVFLMDRTQHELDPVARQNAAACIIKAASAGIDISLAIDGFLPWLNAPANDPRLQIAKGFIIAAALNDRNRKTTFDRLINFFIREIKLFGTNTDNMPVVVLEMLGEIAKQGGNISPALPVITTLMSETTERRERTPVDTVFGALAARNRLLGYVNTDLVVSTRPAVIRALAKACENKASRAAAISLIKDRISNLTYTPWSIEILQGIFCGLIENKTCLKEIQEIVLAYVKRKHAESPGASTGALHLLYLIYKETTGTKFESYEIANEFATEVSLELMSTLGAGQKINAQKLMRTLTAASDDPLTRNQIAAKCASTFNGFGIKRKLEFLDALEGYVLEIWGEDRTAPTIIINAIVQSGWMGKESNDNSVEYANVIEKIARIMDAIKQREKQEDKERRDIKRMWERQAERDV